ncbi:nucleolar transcription factor 1-B-like [Pseudophryne corroboree]|uniref:nucleolar transcription factor 1-B-like n=1 Tax=Pseudophryne corroboree TaxID=495146 RepID=UPI003081E0F0
MSGPSDQDQWSQEDALTLIKSMKASLPFRDEVSYKVALSRMNWDKLAFKTYTGPMCLQKWNEITNRIRRYRTLTELLLDTEEYIKNPYKGKKLKYHPDFPKKPLTPYFSFFIENIKQYETMHPELSHAERHKMLSLIFKELPEEKKKNYIEKYDREKQEFDRNLDKFREEHPDLMESMMNSKRPDQETTNDSEMATEACDELETVVEAKRKKRQRQRKRKKVNPL